MSGQRADGVGADSVPIRFPSAPMSIAMKSTREPILKWCSQWLSKAVNAIFISHSLIFELNSSRMTRISAKVNRFGGDSSHR